MLIDVSLYENRPAQLLSDPLEGFYKNKDIKNQERLTKEKLH